MSVDGIINEQYTNFLGKDGFYWWVGEVEDNEDPLLLGRVKVRVLNYYTDPKGGSASNLPTEDLPWATVLQGTDQAGNDAQGHSSGQLQPGAIVMGFFMDGESAQMPLVMGVIRINKGSADDKKRFLFTREELKANTAPNPSLAGIGETNTTKTNNRKVDRNTVIIPGDGQAPGNSGSPHNIANTSGVNGSSNNAQKARIPPRNNPIPAANGVAGPWKTLEYELNYLIQDLVDSASSLVKADNGEFLDVFENKVVTAQQLTAKLKNFLSAVFAQVVSAIRLQLDALIQQIEDGSFIASFLGIPGTTFAIIQSAIQAILSLICGIDDQLKGFISNPIGSILELVNNLIDGVIDKAAAFVAGVQSVINGIFCAVESVLSSVLNVISSVKDIVAGVGQAKEIIESWQKGSEIFAEGFDISKLNIEGLVDILLLFVSFFDLGCNRTAHGGEDVVGFYPFFGTTLCDPVSLSQIPLGPPNGSCATGLGSGFLDSFMSEADPYLTSAKNFVNGAYQLQLGTPGRQATITKSASGTTHTSIKLNNAELARHKSASAYRQELKRENPTLTNAQVESKVAQYVRQQTKTSTSSSGSTEQGNTTADHTSYAGNHTQEVHGDDCKVIDNDYVRTIEGDYRLKVTGNCHLEVGGGFFLNASGAPRQVDKKGNEKSNSGKIQKHTLTFGSDVDLVVNGANFKAQATEMDLSGRQFKISGSSFKNICKTQTLSGGEVVITAGNAFTVNTTTLTENINFLPPKGVLAGRFCNVGGPILFNQSAALAGGTPPFTVTTPGPFLVTCAAGGASFTVGAGAFNVNVAAGAISMQASLAVSLTATGAMTLKAGPTLIATAGIIKLN